MKKKIETPEVLTNLYRDLRDRRLLIVVVALLIAIVAIPFALGKKADTPPAPLAATPRTTSAELTIPAVTLADQPGITNYRKRLEKFKNENPFKAQFVPKSPTTAGTGSSSSPAGSSSGTSASTSSGSPLPVAPVNTPSGATTTASVTPPPPSDGGSGNGGNGNGGNNHGGGGHTIRTVTQLFTRRVDVTIGKTGGNVKTMNSVEPMTILPNPDTPVIAFLGTDEKGKNAAFVLSSRSVATGGTASCVPSPQNCIYVSMRAGQSITLDYTPEGATDPVSYTLNLTRIRDVNVKNPKSGKSSAGYTAGGSSG